MKIRSIILSLVLMLILSACSAAGTASVTTKGGGIGVPTAQPGKAVVVVKLLDQKNKAPITNQLVRLARIYGEGTDSIYVYNESSDPGGYTANDGTLIIADVEPGPYAVILVNSVGNYAPINESAEKILTVNAEAGKVLDLGSVTANLPDEAK